MFIVTKLSNPHFPPEVTTIVTDVNFTITQEGLEGQLLEYCIIKEKPELEQTRQKLILKKHYNESELKNLENKILQVLNMTTNILDDEQAIEILKTSKTISTEIEEEQRIAVFTEEKIEEARQGYKQIAVHSAILFFAVVQLNQYDCMYQFSLDWFIKLYHHSLLNSEQSKMLGKRVENIINHLTF